MLSTLRVLYVEDDNDILEEVAFFLKKRVKELYIASDGQEGLELFNKHSPDLVITDIQMPVMNGLEMCEHIREKDKNVAIIVTSAYNDNSFLSHSIELAIGGYLIKPINLAKLLETIQRTSEPLILRKEIEHKNEELIRINKNLDKIADEKTKKLEYFYRHDTLTKLKNMVKLNEELNTKEYSLLLLLDISNFSVLNKQYGKKFADSILVEAAEVLKTHETSEILLFKAESDRFVFLLKNPNEALAIHFCKQIIAFFDSTMLKVNSHPVAISFNIGISPICHSTFPIINAEYALDKSKKSGSRFFTFYDDDDTVYKEEKEMIKWLDITKEMIEKDNIQPYYQPILDLKSNTITKYEVLARGFYKNEIIAPVYFLESAKRLGLITSLTRMIINKSFAFFEHNKYEFSINLTERDFLEDYLCDFLDLKTAQYNIDPTRVTFEVLESVTTANENHQIIDKLTSLKKKGFKIAVDDFGIESSNFSRLIEIDFDYIKIDGMFIKNLDINEKDIMIVKAIVNLANTLGIETVAEFVKNKKVLDIVRECGVTSAQGYCIGKPEENLLKDFECKEE